VKIAVLHPSEAASTSPFRGLDPECDPCRYLPEASWTHLVISKATAIKQVIDLSREDFDAVVNLCDGAWDESRPGVEVVQALERLDIAFTGAGSAFYDPSREAMKMAATSAGVSVPSYVIARRPADVERAAARLRFPMIVKHPHGYSSVGLTPTSRVTDIDSLRRETLWTIDQFGAALIEEFVEGREFTVLVTEPHDGEDQPWVLPAVEFVFPSGESFKHFELKWVHYDEMPMRYVDDEVLDRRLRSASALTFEALGGSGYGRCDLRMDATGEIFLLEINPNCSVFYPDDAFAGADFALAGEPDGHRRFLEHLLACARRRREDARVPWELQHDRDHGFGLAATCAIVRGQVVVRYEEASYALVSRQHVDRTWRGLRKEWFERYACPVSENVFQLWSENPEDWRPINHSCDPNIWLEGLDLVARRDISAGEQLTVDYATFSGPSMAMFECHCGSDLCRGVVSGTDFMRDDVISRYGEHVADYVRAAMVGSGSRRQ
jgi:D-alanine-D-alanine ligase-like ATP-grasp enzyme